MQTNKGSLRTLKLIAALPLAALALAACGTIDGKVYVDEPTGTAIKMGQYSTAKAMLTASYAMHPDSPAQQFNLAYVNEKLGRPDLAAPLYRQTVADGFQTFPDIYLSGERNGASLGELACRHLTAISKDPVPATCTVYASNAGQQMSAAR